MNSSNKNIIPIFYAIDKNYLPYLAVSLSSLKDNIKSNYIYKVYILHSNVSKEEQEVILSYNSLNFHVSFINISDRLHEINSDIKLRDYYTNTTYYRIFIADLFLEYDKAIYLDSDTIVLNDIADLYNYDIDNYLVGAINDQVVNTSPVFSKYSLEVLGIDSNEYFNAGVLLINLKEFRNINFYKIFCSLLKIYKFHVAQDQDYLNVICKNRVKLLPISWNIMPTCNNNIKEPNLIHYNLTAKPWHYENIPYAEYFWKYAKDNYYYELIKNSLDNYNEIDRQNDINTEKNLIKLAKNEINKSNNFYHIINKIFGEDYDVLDTIQFNKLNNYCNKFILDLRR